MRRRRVGIWVAGGCGEEGGERGRRGGGWERLAGFVVRSMGSLSLFAYTQQLIRICFCQCCNINNLPWSPQASIYL